MCCTTVQDSDGQLVVGEWSLGLWIADNVSFLDALTSPESVQSLQSPQYPQSVQVLLAHFRVDFRAFK